MEWSRRVLVVDPETEHRQRLASAVEGIDGAQIVEVASVGDARAEVTGATSAVCVVARHAPGGPDGFGVLAELQASEDGPPVVLVLETEAAERTSEALEAGAREVVTSTGDWQLLLRARVERILDADSRETQLETYETIVETMQEGAYVLDEDGDRIFVDGSTSEAFGRPREELLGQSAENYAETGIIDERTLDQYQSHRDAVLSGASESEQIELQLDLPTIDETVTAETRLSRVNRNGDSGAVVGITRDISERKALERQLWESERALRDLYVVSSRSDLDFQTKLEHVLDIGRERVGLDAGFLAVVDPETDTDNEGFRITVDDGNDDQFSKRTEQPLSKTYCRKTVDGNGLLTVTDARAEGWEDDPAYEKFGLACYIGSTVTVDDDLYGTLCFTSREPREEPFTESEQHFVELLTQWISFEVERREREQGLRQLIARINGIIRDVTEVLVECSTREEINHRVCELLAAVEGYDLAWIGDVDVDGATLRPSAWTGTTAVDMDAVELPMDAEQPDPNVRAVREHTAQYQDFGGGGATPLAEEYRAAIAVPLHYKDTEYGVMSVYTKEPDALDEREQVVLSAIGRAIANAYNAIETGQILGTDQVIELECIVDDDDLLFNRIAANAGCALTYAGSVYQPDGSLRLFAKSTDVDPEAIIAAAEDAGVEDASCLADSDEDTLFEFIVEDALVTTLADRGAVVRALSSDAGRGRVTVELPAKANARDIYEFIDDQYGATDLVGYHEHDRPVETREEFRAALEDRLTDRQETALQSAFLSGFFEWPRPVSGDELAGSMDISRPTFHQHLRAAERKVFQELFDPDR